MNPPASGASPTVRVSASEERAVIENVLIAAGAVATDAAVQAEMLVEGDLRGHASHGVRRLPVLVERLRAGLIVSGVDAEHEWTAPGALAVDGRRGFGPVVARKAVDMVLDRARTQGIALASIRNSGHVGMLAPYVESMGAAGCIGIASTISEALVHPWGGIRAMVGTNPLGIGVPTGGEPLVLDMSTGAVSMGKIIDHAARGEAIPLGWAVDSDGRQTTDAAAAVSGAISPFGGAKGYALGIALEALVALLSGSSLGTDVMGTLDTVHPPTKGDVFIAISVEALGLQPRLPAIAAYLDVVRGSGRAAEDGGVPAVSVPGDRARQVRERHLREGVPISAELWQRILMLERGSA
ncbi:Ldh family oxidoreductase [Compostimonas suwonensis]|uniref:LDH2 family malate/lactate/ureidoglycolate dehydrogenase n=1 Tax=Compostimonas suwonensis TaxID=1048394 RepID=A0A2M9BB93_9MICO|nr:Ldh family oxidoreductase [Compostimonas suwonensis]PJJ55209.1 LDH2 family malate/lactate/ureidoglycolate dehydrogenase [Compostimonas suwonensis]